MVESARSHYSYQWLGALCHGSCYPGILLTLKHPSSPRNVFLSLLFLLVYVTYCNEFYYNIFNTFSTSDSIHLSALSLVSPTSLNPVLPLLTSSLFENEFDDPVSFIRVSYRRMGRQWLPRHVTKITNKNKNRKLSFIKNLRIFFKGQRKRKYGPTVYLTKNWCLKWNI